MNLRAGTSEPSPDLNIKRHRVFPNSGENVVNIYWNTTIVIYSITIEQVNSGTNDPFANDTLPLLHS